MKTIIHNSLLVTPDETLSGVNLVLENGRIVELTTALQPSASDDRVVDAQGAMVGPGMIDLHFHGALGLDTMDADPGALRQLAAFCLQHGVTSFYPTTWSAPAADIYDALEAVRQAQAQATNSSLPAGAAILGMHVEGPYLDLEYRGAQLPSSLRLPDPAEYHRWFKSGMVKRVTCAPELPGAEAMIREAVEAGVRVSIGHTHASYEQVEQAAAWGANQATHLFNGMTGLHHRQPGAAGAVLDDPRLFAELICDGVHLHPAVVRLILQAKGPERALLITDAIRGTGLPDGDYDVKGQRFSVREGVARTPAGGLSGSTLTLDRAVRNALQFSQRPIHQVLFMVTAAPADSMGIQDHKGRIRPGLDADLIFFRPEFEVEQVWFAGEPAFPFTASSAR